MAFDEDLTKDSLDPTVYSPTTWRPSRPIGDQRGRTVDDRLLKLHQAVKGLTTTPLATSIIPGNPSALTSLTATESPIKVQTITASQVAISFTRAVGDNFAYLNVWFTGYRGSANPELMASFTTSPGILVVDTTGETVTVTGQTVSTSGIAEPFAACLTTTVVLDGVISAPPAPSISQNLVAIPGGFQFSFNVLSGLPADVVASYNIYRNTANVALGATVIQTIPQNLNNSGVQVVQDFPGGDSVWFYFVSAVNSAGLESTLTPAQSSTQAALTLENAFGKNLLPNPGFEFNASSGAVPNIFNSKVSYPVADGWYISQSDTIGGAPVYAADLDTTLARTGTNSLLIRYLNGGPAIPNNGAFFGMRVYSSTKLPVAQGDIIRVRGWNRWDINTSFPAGITAIMRIGFFLYSANGTALAEFIGDTFNPTGGWVFKDVSFQIPATIGGGSPAYVIPQCCGFIANTGGSAFTPGAGLFQDLRFDDLQVILQVTAFDVTPINTTYLDNSGGAILVQSGATATVTVNAFTLTFGDGTISYNSGSVATGLSLPHTTYIYCLDPTYSGGAVTYLHTEVESTLASQNGVIYIGAITLAGGGGGSGGGGGAGNGNPCFSPNTMLVGKRPICQLKEGDVVLTSKGPRQIEKVHVNWYEGPMHNMGNGELATPGHEFLIDGKEVPARDVWPADVIQYRGYVWNLSIKTTLEEEKNFLLENGYTAHNARMAC